MPWKQPVFIAKVISKRGFCNAGHEFGDTFEINTHKTGGICGFCYFELFPTLMTLAMGGKIPWYKNQNEFVFECPDKRNLVTFKITKTEPK